MLLGPISTALLLCALLPASSGFRMPSAAPQRKQRVTERVRLAPLRMQEEEAPASMPLETYDDAEARGFELYKAGEYDRAIRMFELAQTLPGAGVDFKRQKQGGMIGSATAPPNPREWGVDRFATAEQKAVAEYNIACCYAAMGDKRRAMELLRSYTSKVGEPLNQVNEMLVDEDLISVRQELRELRDEYKRASGEGGGAGGPLGNIPFLKDIPIPSLKDAADKIGVEWKD